MSTPIEYYATGKRKTAIARVRLRAGTGEVHLNDRALDEYFGGHEALKMVAKQPFAITETTEKFDVLAIVHRRRAGGPGRRAAPRHLARAVRVQPGAAQAAQEGGLPHPGRPHQGAQEVRTEGRTPPLPVQQALTSFKSSPARGPASPGRAVAAAADSRRPDCRRRWNSETRAERDPHGEHERAARGGRPLRPPDQALEPEDEGLHLRRAQRHLHHRSPEDAPPAAGRPAVRAGAGRAGPDHPVRGHQAAGPGGGGRGGAALPACPT